MSSSGSHRRRSWQRAERGQTHREALRRLMLDHARRNPLARALTAKELHARYPHIKPSTIAWHIAELRYEAASARIMADIRGDADVADTLENL